MLAVYMERNVKNPGLREFSFDFNRYCDLINKPCLIAELDEIFNHQFVR
jgi:hypothetical protein